MKKERIKMMLPYLFACIFLAIGSFYDYQLTHSLYQKMPIISTFFERLTLIPLLSVVGITLVMLYFVKQKKLYLVFAYAACFYVVSDALQYWIYDSSFLRILMLFVLAGAYLFIMYFILKNCSPIQLEKRLPFLVFFSLVLVTSICITICLKTGWGRIRYRDLVSIEQFTPWYQIQGFNGNFSFPSGHTTCFTSILCLLEYKKNRFEKLSVLRRSIIWGIVLLMPIARMMAGAHYLSDTAVGFMITYSCYIGYRAIFRKRGLL